MKIYELSFKIYLFKQKPKRLTKLRKLKAYWAPKIQKDKEKTLKVENIMAPDTQGNPNKMIN